MAISRLIVVDDDAEMRAMMVQYLQRQGFFVAGAANGADIGALMAAGRIDLILLDVMLGDESGLAICAQLRSEHDVPIIMVSALSSDPQRMAGYASGADDYIAKPFNPDLLLARVRAVLRRTRRAASLSYRRRNAAYAFAGWSYDSGSGAVRAPGGYEVTLSQRETRLLQVFLANPHIPLTREEIAEALDLTRDGPEAQEGRAIDVLVGRLRSKLEDNPRDPTLIRTERGLGYVLAATVQVSDG
ncbi:MAG: response regulator transcription factor [Gemmobacter sp.]|nr:response regulator transcription factor [Gemmobacter sp.]